MAKRKYKKRQTKKSSLDFGVIITIIISSLLTVLIYAESGYVGIVLSDFFGGMFGIIKYIVPIGSFAVAIKMACKDDDGFISSKIAQYTLLLIFIAVILSVYEIYNGAIDINQNISEIVKDAYSLGEKNIGGGALGTIAAVPLFKLFGKIGQNFGIMAPFYCDYGFNIEAGNDFYVNHNCVILDCAKVKFGNNVFIAPNCGFYTAGHPLDKERRNNYIEYAYPITIGNDVWIGANVIVLPGVTIGNNCVIGAGSVVVKDIPDNMLAFGNPCKAIREINDDDKIKNLNWK